MYWLVFLIICLGHRRAADLVGTKYDQWSLEHGARRHNSFELVSWTVLFLSHLLICSSQVLDGGRTAQSPGITWQWLVHGLPWRWRRSRSPWRTESGERWPAWAGYCTLSICNFLHIIFLINIETYLLSVFSLVELRTIYKLGSGKANSKGL